MSDLYMLTPAEAARECGVSETMVRQKMESGEIKSIQWGNERRIPRWYLLRWQAERLGVNESAISALLQQ